MKRYLVSAAGMLGFSVALAVNVAANVGVSVNGTAIEFTGQQPIIQSGSTLVPARGVFEEMGFAVGWNAATNTVTITNSEFTVIVTVGQQNLSVNGQNVQLDVPAQNIGGSTMLPLRAISEAVGADISWNAAAQHAGINFSATPASTSQQQGSIIVGNVVPRPPAVPGGPSNTPVSAQQAVERARDHLLSIGITQAQFNYVYMDIEQGQWVWSVEFGGQGRSFEFYVNVNNGEFLQAPTALASTPGQVTSPAGSPSPSGWPSNPAISREEAATIAQGRVSGQLIEVDHDFERGRAVWYVAIRSGGRVHEVYVDVMTGEIVLHESYSDD